MNNLKITFVFLLLLVFSCSKNQINTSDISPSNQNFSLINNEELTNQFKTVSLIESKVGISEIKDVGQSSLIRNSEFKDKDGWAIPPYNFAYLNFRLNNELYAGDKMTIVPLEVNIESFQIEISKITKKDVVCPNGKASKTFWFIESEKVTDKRILEIQPLENHNPNNPFGVFVIYPAVEYAKSIDKYELTKINLPKNVSLNRVESAIDIDKDSKPDLLSVTFCCGELNKESSKNCPYLCYKYYKKINDNWIILSIDGSEKCVE